MRAPSNIINLQQALSEVRFASARSADSEFEPASGAEAAAIFERGRAEGEKELSEQLLRQRREMLELQQGVLKFMQEAVPQVVRQCEGVVKGVILRFLCGHGGRVFLLFVAQSLCGV